MQFLSVLLATALATVTLAQPLEARADKVQAKWKVVELNAKCADKASACTWSFNITSPGSDTLPAFTATCGPARVPFGDMHLRKCDVTKLDSKDSKLKSKKYNIQKLEAYVSLCPDGKHCISETNSLHVKMTFNKG